MSLRLYNTLTKDKEIFEPVVPGKVGIYLCGPTVYKESHIGHVIGPVIFDALKKYLTYKGYDVTFIINITDVDDKIINESRRLGMEMKDLAEKITTSYFDALNELGVDSVDEFPRATDYIQDMIDMIRDLEAKDAAYALDGDVYFDITKCRDYGKLSHREQDDQLAGTRELTGSSEKRHPADFALWKGAKEGDIGWDSPWGFGRPGWHLECSIMSMKLLGQTYDIHGGGLDLVFPHHENEIAQSETATNKPYVRYWMHNGLTRMRTKMASGEWRDEKMSKSLGNVKPVREVLEEYPPSVIRFFLLSTHYRRPIDFSPEAVEDVHKGMKNIYRLLERVERISGGDVYTEGCNIERLTQLAASEEGKTLQETLTQGQLKFLEMLDDDFNTAGAISVLYELATAVNRTIDQEKIETRKNKGAQELVLEGARMITSLGQVLGLLTGPLPRETSTDELTGKLMDVFIELRAQARKDKQFELADAIRDKLRDIGVELEDRPGGETAWRIS